MYSSDDAIVELQSISCKAGRRYLIRDVNWKIYSGENWVVFGMNGCGKTTLLSIIAGFKHFTEGSLKLFGETVSNKNILKFRSQIGWVSASFFDKYYSMESVLDIVVSGKFGTLGLEQAVTLNDIARVNELLGELQLSDKINLPFTMLSKGERENVLLARALFNCPKILILGEPCTGLDIYNRSYLFETLKNLNKEKKMTIIYVTHYPEEILSLFKHILLLKNGRIVSTGEIDKIFNDKTIEKLLEYPVKISQDEKKRYVVDIHTISHLDTLL